MDHRTTSGRRCTKPARGFAAVGAFLLFGMTMASLAGTTFVWPGTFLDRIWVLNPTAYKQLAPLHRFIGPTFLLLAVALGVAAVGWFLRRLWGWRLAVAIIAIQLLGDLTNVVRGDFVRGPIGFVLAGALLVYLLRREVKGMFVLTDGSRG